MSAHVVHNEAVHMAAAVKAFNEHAVTCLPCSDPLRAYELGETLCEAGKALSGELRNAFRLQESRLESDWPTSFHTMDVKLPLAKGPAAGVVAVMNSRRHRRILDERMSRPVPSVQPIPIPQPIPGPYLQVNRSFPRGAHARTPSDVSTRSEDDPRATYYYRPSSSGMMRNYSSSSSSSYPPATGYMPRGAPVPGQVYYEAGVTQQNPRDEKRRSRVRFE